MVWVEKVKCELGGGDTDMNYCVCAKWVLCCHASRKRNDESGS